MLAVVAAEVLRHSACTLTIGHIAALAGVSETTVRNALRAARGLGLVMIEERRVSAWRNAPNVVTITSREWSAWLRMRGRGVGFNQEPPRLQENNKGPSAQRKRWKAAEGQVAGRDAQQLTRERFAVAWPAPEPSPRERPAGGDRADGRPCLAL